MFCKKCGMRIEVGATFCSNCGQAVTNNSFAAVGAVNQNRGHLLLKSDRSSSKSYKRALPGTIILVVIGLFLIIAYIAIEKLPSYRGYGYRYSSAETMGDIAGVLMIIGGIVLFVVGLLLPFLLSMQAKKNFVDIYEYAVCGGYKETNGSVTKFVPFEITYERIESVSAQKNTVYIQISGRTLECQAYNAEEIARTINSRLHVR